MQKYLAREIIDSGGERHLLAVLTLPGDGSYSIEPFVQETAATVYVDHTLILGSSIPAGYNRMRRCGCEPELWLCKKVNSKKS